MHLNVCGGDGSSGNGNGTRLLNVGRYVRGKGGPLLLLSSNLLLSFCNASNHFCTSKSTPGLGALLINSLTKSFFLITSSRSSNPTIVFYTSKVKMSSNTSLKGFWHRKIFFANGSNFCLKLALLSLFLVR